MICVYIYTADTVTHTQITLGCSIIVLPSHPPTPTPTHLRTQITQACVGDSRGLQPLSLHIPQIPHCPVKALCSQHTPRGYTTGLDGDVVGSYISGYVEGVHVIKDIECAFMLCVWCKRGGVGCRGVVGCVYMCVCVMCHILNVTLSYINQYHTQHITHNISCTKTTTHSHHHTHLHCFETHNHDRIT